MGKDDGNWYDVDQLFTGTRSLSVMGITLVMALYALLTKDTKPLAVFVMIMSAIFLFDLVNLLLGKLNS